MSEVVNALVLHVVTYRKALVVVRTTCFAFPDEVTAMLLCCAMVIFRAFVTVEFAFVKDAVESAEDRASLYVPAELACA